ncbi:MAG: hypothetical protein JJE21_06185 [Spirochaetaceae bacterium]|nr:hypothetical protein [Spirochaetaceae bacterium]
MTKNSFLQSVLDQWQVKLVCVLLALSCYFLVNFSSYTDRQVVVPLEVIFPVNYEAESLVPNSITININGSESIIYLIDPALVIASVDFSNINNIGISRRTVVLSYDDKVFDKGEIIVSAVPETIRIAFKDKNISE